MSTEEVRTHSALHVLKGAVVRAFGPRKTLSTRTSGTSGTLSVEFDRTPGEEEIQSIEHLANRKIAENSEVLQFEMERQEAEGHFGPAIYDEPPAPGATRVSILRIPEWEVSCCDRKHIDTTGELIRIRIEKTRYNAGESRLEIDFQTPA
ncbi:MAG: alanyl-tRNA editing protein [Thaumarchaeota archaeon]|nr:alanyl-tRNA editing protein [Nitrososphaerota archaeon]